MHSALTALLMTSLMACSALFWSSLAHAELENGMERDRAGYTTGAACEKLRTKTAEDFLKKNYELFGLKENRKIISVKEDPPSANNNLQTESKIVIVFEQKTGSFIETVELRMSGRKNFECDDFRADGIELEITNFRLE